jgi:uncharacterized DUF497 family protein
VVDEIKNLRAQLEFETLRERRRFENREVEVAQAVTLFTDDAEVVVAQAEIDCQVAIEAVAVLYVSGVRILFSPASGISARGATAAEIALQEIFERGEETWCEVISRQGDRREASAHMTLLSARRRGDSRSGGPAVNSLSHPLCSVIFLTVTFSSGCFALPASTISLTACVVDWAKSCAGSSSPSIHKITFS